MNRVLLQTIVTVAVVALCLGGCQWVVYAPPVFDPPGGTYTKPVNVIITTDTPGAVIRYTTDGTDPIADDSIEQLEYPRDPLLIGEGTTTVKAFSWSSGTDHSEIVHATYKVVRVYSSDWVDISAGGWHAFARKSDRTLWGWGGNPDGRLGDGTTESRADMVQIGTDTDWADVVGAKGWFSLGVKTGGTLWAWGDNSYAGISSTIPMQVGSDTDWLMVTAGETFAAALKSDGTLWAWGANGRGQIGDWTTENRLTPVQVGTDSDWVFVDAGAYHTVGIRAGTLLFGWGDNFYYQINDTTGNWTWPQPILPVIQSVSAGWYHNAGVKTDGSLWARGNDEHGELGSAVSGIIWVSLDAGWGHTVAIDASGALWSWGDNQYGQLGDGTTTSRDTPLQVGSDTDWARVEAGREYTVALKADGTLWAWGAGCGRDKLVPTQVGIFSQ